MALNVQASYSGFTITVTVTGGGPTTGATIENAFPARVPLAGTPMVHTPGTTYVFTYTVPGPGTYNITVTSGTDVGSASVTIP